MLYTIMYNSILRKRTIRQDPGCARARRAKAGAHRARSSAVTGGASPSYALCGDVRGTPCPGYAMSKARLNREAR